VITIEFEVILNKDLHEQKGNMITLNDVMISFKTNIKPQMIHKRFFFDNFLDFASNHFKTFKYTQIFVTMNNNSHAVMIGLNKKTLNISNFLKNSNLLPTMLLEKKILTST